MAGSPTFPTKLRNQRVFIKWNSLKFIRNHQALLNRKVSFDKTQQISRSIGKSWTGSWPRFFPSAVEQLNKPSLPMPRKDKTLKLNHIVVNRSAWWFLINIGKFHLIKPNRFPDLLEKVGLPAIYTFFFIIKNQQNFAQAHCSYFVLNCNIFFYGWKSTLKAFRCLCISSFFYLRTCVHARHIILMVLHVLHQVIISNESYLTL